MALMARRGQVLMRDAPHTAAPVGECGAGCCRASGPGSG